MSPPVWFRGIALLLIFLAWLTRLHNVLMLPLFIDEATHITRAQAVWTAGAPFDLILTGKALTPYLTALFYPFAGAPFIGRFVVVLISGIGVAAAIALGSAIYSRAAGLLAGVLWLLCPYFFFFERMALVDTALAALATLAACFAVRMIRRGHLLDAILCGLTLALCFLTKTTGIVFFVIPGVAAVLLPGAIGFRRRIGLAVIAYLVLAGLLAAPALYIASQSANVFGIGAIASAQTNGLGERITHNVIASWDAYRTYFSAPFWGLLLLAAAIGLVSHPRRGLFLLALIVAPLGTLLATASLLYLRYLVIGVPGILLLTAIGIVELAGWLRSPLPQGEGLGVRARAGMRVLIPTFAIGIWAIGFALPFMATAYSDPSALILPDNDRSEYITDWTAGYGLRDMADYLLKQAATLTDHAQTPLIATGMVGSCNAIRLYVPPSAPVTVQCPDVWDASGAGMREGYDEIVNRAQEKGTALVIGEQNGAVGENAIPSPHEVLLTIARPGESSSVVLYAVSAPP